MDNKQFNQLIADMRIKQDTILKTKGADYTRQNADKLNNFKRLAADLNIHPMIVWAIYAGKHWDAIMSAVKTGKTESEPLEGRFIDLQNYLYLGLALYQETDAQDKPAVISGFGPGAETTPGAIIWAPSPEPI